MKISNLKPDPKNANLGTERGRKMLADSLAQFGAGRSILLDKKGRVIAGNKTLEQAKAAGHKDVLVVPSDGKKLVVVQRTDLDLSDPKARALAIADNRVAETDLKWDVQVLRDLEKSIDMGAFFTADEMADLQGSAGAGGSGASVPAAKIDQAARLLKKWGAKSGQLWEVGRHRILCGDSNDQQQVLRLLDGRHATMAFLDPPSDEHRQKYSVYSNLALYVDHDCYVVMGAREWPAADQALRKAGMHWSGTIAWVKDQADKKKQFDGRYEPIWYGWSAKSKSSYRGGRAQDDVWEFALPKSPTEQRQLPAELVARAIKNSSRQGDRVLDLHLGAGTTAAAAEQNDRACFGMDIDPAMIAVTLERLSEMGLTPKAK